MNHELRPARERARLLEAYPGRRRRRPLHQGWQGRRGARGAGRQKRAPRGGARGRSKKMRGATWKHDDEECST